MPVLSGRPSPSLSWLFTRAIAACTAGQQYERKAVSLFPVSAQISADHEHRAWS